MQDFNKDVKKIGLGGMNTSIVDTLLPANMVRTIRNGHIFDSNDNRDGTARNVLGNVNVSYREEDFGDGAEVIGSCRNEQDNTIIFFVAAGPGYRDSIMEYSPDLGTVVSVLNSTDNFWLYFSKDYRIKGAFVIDGLLYWNDANNGLRKLNIAKSKAWANGDYINGYSSMDEQTISLIKYPPLEMINPYYFTDETRKMNSLRGLLFQFRYTYIYDDNEVSVTSIISKIAIPVGEMDFSGEIAGNLSVNNGIGLTLNTGHSTVLKIGVYFRIGNVGNWGLVDIIDKSLLNLSDNASYIYNFYNDRVVTGVDQNIINKLSHAIPFKADMLGYLHTNSLLIGGLTEGYSNIDNIMVDLNPVLSKIDHIQIVEKVNEWSDIPVTYEIEETIFMSGMDVYSITLGSLPTLNNVIRITIEGQVEEIFVDGNDALDVDSFRTSLMTAINQGFSSYSALMELPTINGNVIGPNSLFVFKTTNNSCGPGNTDCNFNLTIEEYTTERGAYRSYPSFKSGATHKFGLIYYDAAGRSSFVQKASDTYLPFITEEDAPITDGGTTQNYGYSIKWDILHEAPSWAVKYQWCRQSNTNVVSFRRYIIDYVVQGLTPDPLPDPPVIGAPDPDKASINISPLNKHKVQYNGYDYSFPSSSITPYVFQEGDRVRFITKTKTDFSGGEDDEGLGDILGFYLDLEILEYQVLAPEVSGEGTSDAVPINSIIVQRFDQYEWVNFEDIGPNTLIEIYTPKLQQEDAIYYETGELFNTIKDTVNNLTLHEGSTQNQVWSEVMGELVPAKGVFTSGDVYLVPTVFVKNLGDIITDETGGLIESQSASNFYDQDYHNIGRPNIINKKAERKKNLNLRLSGKYFEGTEINGLSEFYGGADLYVSAEFGDTITGLREVGFTLKALQERKVTSFFVGRTGLQLASGAATDEIMANSDAALSTKSPSQESRGTTNPESVLVVDRHLYFVDVNNGAIVRDAANGMFDIDPYGIQKDIKYICNLLRTEYTSSRVLTSYNPVNNQVGFSFVGFNKNGSRDFGTYYFKNDKNQWTCIFDYYDAAGSSINEFASINQNYISFVGTKIWLHDKNPLKNNFYGSQLPFVIEMIFNKANGLPKLYKTIEIIGKGEWSCPEYGDVKIESKNAVIAKEQTSRLVKGKFKNIKGKQIAVLLKDSNTQNGSNQTKNLMNGNDLKGSVLFIRLVNTESTEAIIDSVATLYQVLKLS